MTNNTDQSSIAGVKKILEEHGITVKGQDYAPYGTRYSDILNAMQEYANLKCKSLVEALDLVYAYLDSGMTINPHSGIHNTVEKALQDYRQQII